MTRVAVALVDSLLTAMVRADGDALVMHVGERPIVVSGSRTIDLSTHGMNLSAMVGMLGQLLTGDALAALKELGAVEHALPPRGTDSFSVVAARSGDDIWIEIRRRREAPQPVAADAETAAVEPQPIERHETEPAPAQETPEPMAVAADEGTAPEQPGPSADAVELRPASGETHVEPEAVLAAEAVRPTADLTADTPAAETPAAAAGDEPPPAGEPEPTVIEAEPTATSPEMTAMPELEQPHTEPVPEPVATGVVPEAQPELAEAVAEPQPATESGTEEAAAPSLEATPVMASAAATAQLVSSTPVTPMAPMETSRHTGPAAGGPPSRPTPPPPTPGAEEGISAPEAPVTRTVRIEVPDRAAPPSRATGIDRLLRAADSVGASELFVVSQTRPYVRVGGNVRPLQEEAPLLPSDIDALIADVTPEPWRDAVRRGDPAEWLIELSDVGRVRCSTFRDHRGPGANFHFAFLRATTADDLQLSADARLLATEPDGLILVAGGAGSDAAAIVAAFVDILNRQRADYIITLEPQIRVQHANREALVSQREVGHDGGRAVAAARAALREEPDVLVIEGIATAEMAQLAIEASAQDRLVIASIDAVSAVPALQRLVELVPAEQRSSACAALSRSFRGAVAQLLMRKATGGRIAARELLTGTRAVARILSAGDIARLDEALDTPGPAGMAPLTDEIVQYVRSGLVDVREAVRKAPDVERLLSRLKSAGVDVSAIER